MKFSFSTILIPVDFSINTKLAIQKALLLADWAKPTIHLLHILKAPSVQGGYSMHGISYQPPSQNEDLSSETNFRLQILKKVVGRSLPTATIFTHVMRGEVIENEVIRFARQFRPQLIIIGKHEYHNLLPFMKTVNPDFISKKTNCAVLTVRPGSVENIAKTIIIPVRYFIPKRKIELLFALAGHDKPQVHLVVIEKKSGHNAEVRQALFQTYQLLSQDLDFPVQDKIIKDNNFAKAILKHAKMISADMVILNPYEESKINFISGMHINDFILPRSKLSILSAKPYASSEQ